MPRIAILSSFLRRKGGHGGVTPWLINLANELHGRQISTEILVSTVSTMPLSHNNLAHDIPITNLGRHYPVAMYKLIRYLRRARPEIVLAAGYRYNALALDAKRWAGVRLRVYASIHENVSAGSQDIDPAKRSRRFRAIAQSYPAADGVIAVSQGVAEDLIHAIGLPQSIIKVLYNPVVPSDVMERAQDAITHPWLVDHARSVILGVGRLERQKDFSTLMRAFARVSKQRPFRLIILGEGSQRKNLESLAGELGIADMVSMPGHVPNPYAYMARCDLFVLSSLWEGFGNVLAEALAVGIPVISTDCPSGPREILADGAYGPLVTVGDDVALADAILKVVDNPQPSQRLRARALAFSSRACVDAYIDYLGLSDQS